MLISFPYYPCFHYNVKVSIDWNFPTFPAHPSLTSQQPNCLLLLNILFQPQKNLLYTICIQFILSHSSSLAKPCLFYSQKSSWNPLFINSTQYHSLLGKKIKSQIHGHSLFSPIIYLWQRHQQNIYSFPPIVLKISYYLNILIISFTSSTASANIHIYYMSFMNRYLFAAFTTL